MKIIKKAETKKIPFMEIQVGECFAFRDELYIKILALTDEDCDTYNAIFLGDGVVTEFMQNDLVSAVDAEIFWKEK